MVSRRFLSCLSPAAVLCVAAAALPAQAKLSISTRATRNVTCMAGVCTSTARNAVLNVNDLTGLLASSDVAVDSAAGAEDILVEAAVGWSGASLLTLDATRSVTIDRPVTVAGSGGLVVMTNDGGINGLLSFGGKGDVAFTNLHSSLTINRQPYALAESIGVLAAAIAANPGGNFALANSYDARGDGTYTAPPIPTTFTGSFEGLGNTISNLSVNDSNGTNVGLFADVGSGGTLAGIRLTNATVVSRSSKAAAPTGILVGLNEGSILGASATGKVSGSAGNYPEVGGLAGANTGSIAYSHAIVNVTAGNSGIAGGLIGEAQSGIVYASSAAGSVSGGHGSEAGGLAGANAGQIEQCFATGPVTTATESKAGGLIGFDSGPVSDSYATGSNTQAGALGYAGGFVGFFQPDGTNTMARNYSTGAVSGGNLLGGFIGDDTSSGTNLAQNYWDMTTSGIDNPGQGAGFPQNDQGIAGLSSRQLRADLPYGFLRATWAQARAINQGFPYLRNNPPPKH